MFIKDREGEFEIVHNTYRRLGDGEVVNFYNLFLGDVLYSCKVCNTDYTFYAQSREDKVDIIIPVLSTLTEEEYFLFSTGWCFNSSLELMHSFQEYSFSADIEFKNNLKSVIKIVKLQY